MLLRSTLETKYRTIWRHFVRPEPPQANHRLNRGPTGFQEPPGGAQDEPRGPKGSFTWPKRVPRSRQDGQLEPRWSHHGPNMAKDASPWAQQHVKITQERAKIWPRWPNWIQDGAYMALRWPKLRQHGPRRAPRSAQDGQVGAKMKTTWPQDAKDAPAWADTCAYLEKPSFSFGKRLYK